MTTIAVSTDSITVYYSSIIIALGIAAGLSLAFALSCLKGVRTGAFLIYAPCGVLLGVFFSRCIHWYCHSEQYVSFISAVTDFSTGDFVLSGAIIAIVLAALVLRAVKLVDSAAVLLDCTAPGFALAAAFIRLSCLFNTSCISKIAVTDTRYQRLPFAWTFTDAAGNIGYRFATFAAEIIVLSALLLIAVVFLFTGGTRKPKCGRTNNGSTAMLFLAWYDAAEIILDSTRYDSSFAHFNGFVSVVQMFCAITLIAVFVFYTVRASRSRSGRVIMLALVFLIGLAVTGVSEYYVQRRGNLYRVCYSAMTAGCLTMAICTLSMFRRQCILKKDT